MKQLLRLLLVAALVGGCSLNLFARGNLYWSSGRFRLEVSGRTMTVFSGNFKLLTIASLNFNFARPVTMVAARQTPDTLALNCLYPPDAGYDEERGDLTATVEVTVSGSAIRFTSNPAWASNTTIELADAGEHYFGILEPLYPNNRRSPDLRGEVVDVEVLGNGGQYHENFSSVWSAFTMTNKGYASFFDTFAAGRYTLGINGKTELYHHTGKLDWYIIAGNSGDELLRTYYKIIGHPKHVPLWACGPIGWRNENRGGKDEILDDLQKMTDLRIPFTSWFVDRPYSHGANGWSKMDFDDRFPDPAEWIATIRQKYGMEFMSWVGSLTFDDKDFPGLLPGERGYMDLSDPAAVAEFGKRLKENQYAAGVRGHKLDRGDEYFPEMEPWHDRTPIPERRNKYIYLFAKTVDGYLREMYGQDQVTFARGAYQRCQAYLTAVWGGDSRCSWDGLASSVANAVRCGFMGFPVWGSDVGGYLGGRIPEALYARWLELGSWSGLFEIKLDHEGDTAGDRPPWKYPERLQSIFRECATRRMEFQPYFYSLANTSSTDGVIMKPLAYCYPNDARTYSIGDEFQVGNTFLVAPIADSTDSRPVYLPEGTWYDFYNFRKTYKGGKDIVSAQPLERIPVFIRENSLYVTGTLLPGNSKLWDPEGAGKTLNIVAFPGRDGSGTSFTFVDYLDADKEKNLTLSVEKKGVKFAAPALSSDASLMVKLGSKAVGVELNGKKAGVVWDSERNMAVIRLKKGIENSVSIRR